MIPHEINCAEGAHQGGVLASKSEGGWDVLNLNTIGEWLGKNMSRKDAEVLAKKAGEVVKINAGEQRIYVNKRSSRLMK